MSRAVNKFITATSGSGAGDVIEQSLMFNTADTAYLNRTPSSAGNRRTFTLSTWLKTTDGFAGDPIFCCSTGTNDASTTYIAFYQGKMYYYGYNTIYRTTNRVFRDVGAWYHFVWAIDSTQGTADNRIRLYVNGVEETSFATKNNPAQNYDFIINSTNEHQLGDEGNQTGGFPPFDGSMAEVHFIDGAQLTPSSFGETDSDTGEWIPKETTGLTYGTNGFYLKFVSGAIGTDSSGQGNNYTANNLTNADVLLDTPNNNFPTINSLEPYNTTISNLSQGNLHVKAVTYDSGYYGNHIATFKVPESGKWYIETRMAVESGTGNTSWIGVMPQTLAIIPKDGTGATDGNYAANSSFTGMVADLISGVDTIRLFDGGSAQATISSATATSYIIALALDVDNNKVYGGYDSGSGITWLASGDPAAGSNGQSHTFTSDTIIQLEVGPNSGSNSNSKQTLNFGQNGTFCGLETAGGNSDSAGEGNFFYSPPSGFKALCSKNLPNPAIKKSAEHFNTILYTGNETEDRALTGVGFRPDWVWLKSRSNAYWHQLHDAVRGVAGGLLHSNRTDAQDGTYSLVSLDSDGFTVMKDQANDGQNDDGLNYVAWNWRLEGATPSKTYTTKVVSDSGNKYRFDDYGTSAVTLNLQEGGTYTFDQSDSSNSGHPLRFSTTSDGSHGGGSEYTTGVTTSGTPGSSGAYTRITVAASAATLYYYCTAHSGMGGQANTTITFGSTNLDGGSLSTVSVNTTAGVSIINVVGTGSDTTYGHGLGVIPKVYIVKLTSGANDWYLQTSALDGGWDYLQLNTTAASNSMSATAPTSSVLYSSVTSSATAVYYAFAEIAGFSKFGSYSGNGAAEDGPFVFTGFSPALVIIKETSESGGSWFMWDNKREVGNVKDAVVWADAANAETSHAEYEIDFLSNGFKLRGNSGGTNDSGETNVYMAWAESPFKYANAK